MNLLTLIRYLPYRVIRKIGTADISHVFGVECSQLRNTALPAPFRFAQLNVEELRALIGQHPQLFDESQVRQLTIERINCFAIFNGQIVAAFAWLATGNIPAEFNHNGDLLAGLPIEMPDDTGYIYNVFVMPEYRGQRLYGALVTGLAHFVLDRGITRLLLTTDTTNHSSLRAVRRMGFQDLGRAWLFRLGRLSIASYPPSPVFDSVRFGRYTGDWRRT
jgi:ribosomal protein S18 acetylase RimI-like enzyme